MARSRRARRPDPGVPRLDLDTPPRWRSPCLLDRDRLLRWTRRQRASARGSSDWLRRGKADAAARAGVIVSTSAIQRGVLAGCPCLGLFFHCLAASTRNRSPMVTSSQLTPVAVALSGSSLSPSATTTMTLTADRPTTHPAANPSPVVRDLEVPSITTTATTGIGLRATAAPQSGGRQPPRSTPAKSFRSATLPRRPRFETNYSGNIPARGHDARMPRGALYFCAGDQTSPLSFGPRVRVRFRCWLPSAFMV